MESDRRQEVLRLYHLALARDLEDRPAFLADACTGDRELRSRVEALLAQDPPSDFLLTAPGTGGLNPDIDSQHSLIGRHIGPYRWRGDSLAYSPHMTRQLSCDAVK
jgi:hypothetical protein